MRLLLPLPPDNYDREYFRRSFSMLEDASAQNVTKQEATPFVMLIAPDNSVWKVTVDNSGNLQTASVALGGV